MSNCWHENERIGKTTFGATFPNAETFTAATGYIDEGGTITTSSTGIIPILTKDETEQLYYLLAGKYWTSRIKYSTGRLCYGTICTIIRTYGLQWKKEKEILNKLMQLTYEEIRTGDTRINNNAENPSIEPTTETLDELTYIDNQNVTREKLSAMNSLGIYREMIKEDKDEWFINKFKVLFMKFPTIEEDGNFGG